MNVAPDNGQAHTRNGNGSAPEIAWSPEEAAARFAEIAAMRASLLAGSIELPVSKKPSGKGNGRAGAGAAEKPPAWLMLPDGKLLSASALTPLWRDDYTDPEKIHLIVKDGGGYHVDPRGFPLVLAYTSPEQCEPGTASEAARVTLCWSNAREIYGEQTVSMKDVATGEYLDRFGSRPFTSRAEQARIANVLKAQIMPLPVRLAPAVSGWSRSPSGTPRFVLEDRLSWWTIGNNGEPKIDGPAIAPPIPTPADAAYLVNAWSSWGPDGRGVAVLAFAIRGLFASLKPVGTSLVLTGDTGSSKTTAGRFALGLLGAVKQDATPTLTFTASAAAMKDKRAWRNDLPSLFDDFHKLANEGGLARMFDAIDAMLRAIADGDEWNARARRDGKLRAPVYLRGADIFTGEMIDGLLASAERRMAWIGYPDDLNSDDIYEQWDALQRIWEGVGHAVIQSALPIFAAPGGRDKLAGYLDKLDRSGTDAIFDTLARERPQAPHKFIRSIARNWAPILTGAVLADRAIGEKDGNGPFTETLRQTLAGLALRQLDRLAEAAPDGMTAEWVMGAIRWAFGAGRYLKARRTDDFLNAASVKQLADYGYVRVARGQNFDSSPKWLWETRAGPHLGWLDDDGSTLLLRPEQLFDVLRDYAARPASKIHFDIRSHDKLAAGLVKCGAAKADTSLSRQGRPSQRRHIPEGHPDYTYVIVIPHTHDKNADPADPTDPTEKNLDISINCVDFCRVRAEIAVDPTDPNADLSGPSGPRSIVCGPDKYQEKINNYQSVTKFGSVGSAGSTFLRSHMHLHRGEGGPEDRAGADKPIAFAIPPQLAAAFRNPINPHCQWPQAAQDGPSRATAPTEPSPAESPPAASSEAASAPIVTEARIASEPAPSTSEAQDGRAPATAPIGPPPAGNAPAASSEAAGLATRRRLRRAIASAPHRHSAFIVLDAEKVACVDRSGSMVVENHTPATRPTSFKKAKQGALEALLDFAKTKTAERICVTRSWAVAAGLPDRKSLPIAGLDHRIAVLPEAAPWALDKPRLRRSMFASHRSGGRAIELYFPAYHPEIKVGDESAESFAASLSMFERATSTKDRGGFPWRPGVFTKMWERLSSDPGTVDINENLAPDRYPPPAHMEPEPAADLAWSRAPTNIERNAKLCVVVDGVSQYLRAMAGMLCGVGLPEHAIKPAYDKKSPGYWLVTYHVDWPETLPSPGWPLDPGEQGWLTTDTVAFLEEIGARIEIEEAWLWRGAAALARLQERFRDVLYFAKDEKQKGMLGAKGTESFVKVEYKEGVGRWSRREDRKLAAPVFGHRPHWRHGVMARSTFLLLRDLRFKTGGRHPVAIATDGLAFLTDKDDSEAFLAELGLPIGNRLGQYEFKRAFDARPMIEALDDPQGSPLGLFTGKTDANG